MDLSPTPSLLGAPPEIRNAIYELLFVHEQPIELRLGESDVLRGNIPGINLLATSSQLHAEATAILYARNTFAVPFYEGQGQGVKLASEWLGVIHSSGKLVTKINIEMGRREGFNFLTYHGPSLRNFNALPLLHHVWRRQKGQLEVVFTSTPRYELPGAAEIASTTNALFQAVALRTHADWSIFSRLCKVLQGVDLRSDLGTIVFRFGYGRFYGTREMQRTVTYTVDSTGTIDRLAHTSDKSSLHRLMQLPNAGPTLMEMLARPQNNLVYDLDKHSISHPVPVFMAVDRTLRQVAYQHWSDTHVEVLLNTSSMSALERWLEDQIMFDDWDDDFWFRSIHIVLNVQLNDALDLDDFRFDGLQLITILVMNDFPLETNISMQTRYPDAPAASRRVETSFSVINNKLLIFMAEILSISTLNTFKILHANLDISFDSSYTPREAILTLGKLDIKIQGEDTVWSDEATMKVKVSKARRSVQTVCDANPIDDFQEGPPVTFLDWAGSIL